jgi:DNA repair exonuclease SbcCD ATPase subunit
VARDAFEALKHAGSGDLDEYIREFDAEIAAKNDQLEEAEEEIRRLRAQQRPYLVAPKGAGVQLSTGGEQEFFDGEFLEVIVDSLNSALNNTQNDSRRQHILSAIANSNSAKGELRERRERLKDVLRQYQSMEKHTARELGGLGFTISEDGKQFKITYMGDDRYVFALPKSGSDHRGGLNAASDIGKRVF